MGGDHRSLLVQHRETVLDVVAKQPDLTLQEIRGALARQHGIAVGLTTLWRFLTGQRITLKKRAYTPRRRIVPT
jgi:transposase